MYYKKSTCLGLAGLLTTRWLEGDEADALHLPGVVEADDADVGVRVLLLDLLQLLEHLRGVGAPEHGQLPHCPVPPVVVPRRAVVLTEHKADLAELKARNPLGADQVLDLLQERLHGERGQVREGLELLDALDRPHLHAADPSAVADAAEAVGGAAAEGEAGGGLEALERGHGGGGGSHHGGCHGCARTSV